MQTRVSELLAEIRRLEDQLEDAIRTHEVDFLYRIDGTKIRFEQAVRRAHRNLKVGLIRWLRTSELRNVITAPVVYAMIVPLVILDAAVSLYQLVCFPLYRIPFVRRRSFIVLDRHHLSYLNVIEKIHCVYCGYTTGLIAYAREIVARTEQYWCPVKHARKILDPHRRYARFSDFGDAEDYPEHAARMRELLAETEAE